MKEGKESVNVAAPKSTTSIFEDAPPLFCPALKKCSFSLLCFISILETYQAMLLCSGSLRLQYFVTYEKTKENGIYDMCTRIMGIHSKLCFLTGTPEYAGKAKAFFISLHWYYPRGFGWIKLETTYKSLRTLGFQQDANCHI